MTTFVGILTSQNQYIQQSSYPSPLNGDLQLLGRHKWKIEPYTTRFFITKRAPEVQILRKRAPKYSFKRKDRIHLCGREWSFCHSVQPFLQLLNHNSNAKGLLVMKLLLLFTLSGKREEKTFRSEKIKPKKKY